MKRLPPLNSLRAFVVAAKHLSFTKAARELFVTPGAVSQQVKQLEDHLGCTLFRRTKQALLLTDEGQACLPGLIDAFDRMHASLELIETNKQSGVLAVSLAPSFAAKWLVPRLDAFQEQYGDIDVRISVSAGLVNFDDEDIDCAIRYGGGNYPGLLIEKVLSESVYPVCSPDLTKGAGALRAPADLKAHTLLHDESPDQDPSCPDWAMWLRAAGVTGVNPSRGLKFNQSSLVLEAAIAGRGVALAKARLAARDIRAGRLVRLFNRSHPVDFAYYFVCPKSKATLRKVQLFKEWVLEEARHTED